MNPRQAPCLLVLFELCRPTQTNFKTNLQSVNRSSLALDPPVACPFEARAPSSGLPAILLQVPLFATHIRWFFWPIVVIHN